MHTLWRGWFHLHLGNIAMPMISYYLSVDSVRMSEEVILIWFATEMAWTLTTWCSHWVHKTLRVGSGGGGEELVQVPHCVSQLCHSFCSRPFLPAMEPHCDPGDKKNYFILINQITRRSVLLQGSQCISRVEAAPGQLLQPQVAVRGWSNRYEIRLWIGLRRV